MKLKEGEGLPFGFGYAWSNFNSDTHEAYPVPFNLFFRWLRTVWFFLHRKRKDRYDKVFEEGFRKGKEWGRSWQLDRKKIIEDWLEIEMKGSKTGIKEK